MLSKKRKEKQGIKQYKVSPVVVEICWLLAGNKCMAYRLEGYISKCESSVSSHGVIMGG